MRGRMSQIADVKRVKLGKQKQCRERTPSSEPPLSARIGCLFRPVEVARGRSSLRCSDGRGLVLPVRIAAGTFRGQSEKICITKHFESQGDWCFGRPYGTIGFPWGLTLGGGGGSGGVLPGEGEKSRRLAGLGEPDRPISGR